MTKAKVDEQQYVRLIREKMQEHPQYREGMGVELSPAGVGKPLGFSPVGEPEADARTVMAWAESEVRREYELDVSDSI